jgi:hypothetical protein
VGVGDGLGCFGLGVFGDALHAVLEAFEAFAEALAELGELLAAEEDNGNHGEDDQVCRCEKFTHESFSYCCTYDAQTATIHCRTAGIEVAVRGYTLGVGWWMSWRRVRG